jgi:hypothetical protein
MDLAQAAVLVSLVAISVIIVYICARCFRCLERYMMGQPGGYMAV